MGFSPWSPPARDCEENRGLNVFHSALGHVSGSSRPKALVQWAPSLHWAVNRVVSSHQEWERLLTFASLWLLQQTSPVHQSLLSHLSSVLFPALALLSQVVLVVKNPPANAGDMRDAGSIARSGRSLAGGHGTPLWYSCLEKPTDRGARWATVHAVTKS